MNNLINSINIGSKIALGFLSILIIFSVLGYVILDSLNSVSVRSAEMNNVRQNTTTILSIQRDVSELQRITLVYGQSGKNAYIERMNRITKEIKNDLKLVRGHISNSKDLEIIEKMISVIDNYSSNIEVMKNKFTVMSELIDKKLPEVISTGSSFLQKKIEGLEKSHDVQATARFRQLLELWLDSHIKAVLFIQQRKYP